MAEKILEYRLVSKERSFNGETNSLGAKEAFETLKERLGNLQRFKPDSRVYQLGLGDADERQEAYWYTDGLVVIAGYEARDGVGTHRRLVVIDNGVYARVIKSDTHNMDRPTPLPPEPYHPVGKAAGAERERFIKESRIGDIYHSVVDGFGNIVVSQTLPLDELKINLSHFGGVHASILLKEANLIPVIKP